MPKDTFYFSHDYNAHNDFKILFLREKFGMEGYGIYWFIIEALANAGGYLPIKAIPVLAMQMQSDKNVVKQIIEDFQLFEINEENFSSNRLLSHINFRKTLSINGSKGAAKKHGYGEAMAGLQDGFSNPYAKERKGKERKEKKEKNKKENFAVGTEENIRELCPRGSEFFGQSAISVSDDGFYAIFEDGFRQEMGHFQKIYLKTNRICDIKRGIIC